MSLFSNRLGNTQVVEAALGGIKAMVPVVSILILAWCLAQVTNEMQTASFLISILSNNVSPYFIPAITFVLSGIVAFATGTSWGTMAIMYPLVLPSTYVLSVEYGLPIEHTMNLFSISVASVLAGAVFGDHCSPISDTTILSSLASGCNHINHVNTQVPYALTVGITALVLGIIPASFGVSSWITLPVAIAILYMVIRKMGRKIQYEEN